MSNVNSIIEKYGKEAGLKMVGKILNYINLKLLEYCDEENENKNLFNESYMDVMVMYAEMQKAYLTIQAELNE